MACQQSRYPYELPSEMEVDKDENGCKETSVCDISTPQPTEAGDRNQLMYATTINTLMRQDALSFFKGHCQEINEFWSRLARKTTIPANTMLGDAIITSAFATIDDAIRHHGDRKWALRLAYVQLSRVLAFVKPIIARRGRLRRGVGKGDTSVLIDLYVKAQTEPFSPKELRRQVQSRMRIARRWADLISGSIFLATAYNNKAEMMIA
ncbi:hypothetical protein PT974_02880 [Cladobotryum mycophilum]|uniref:Uncharacterized protein n=1 Tax=Cladobotryum mycophilum TaxID=491253 RepID=A0ABR0T066_9HYPO